MGYGFSIADNPADRCGLASVADSEHAQEVLHLEFQQASSNHASDQVRPLRDQKVSSKVAHWVRLRNSILDKVSNDKKPSYEFSPGFLDEISAALANNRERTIGVSCFQGHTDFSGGTLSRNKLKVIATVAMIVQRQFLIISVHNSILPQWPETASEFHAARYRRSQLYILRSVNTSILSRLSDLVGVTDQSARDVRIVRLEHMLTQSPSPVLTDYRALLNAGLGTRKAAKIKKHGLVECAFTLWVCGIWLWSQSSYLETNDSGTPSIQQYVCQWLTFLDVNYPRAPSSRQKSGGENGPVIASKHQDDGLTIASYLKAIEAAVQKNPNSLYSNPACTTSRLQWCLDIVREESVMCPSLEGSPDEDSDELVMFLEA